MAMQLVRKKNPTGGSIHWLRPEEEDAVKAYYSSREPLSTGELALAGSVLQEMRQKEAWLECDCVRGEHPARNSANLMKDIRDAFIHFPAGTAVLDIWAWFETSNSSFVVARMLYG
ncbi:hypothetical protein M5Y49_26125 [Escherichia coli]|nr:hypothetical protein [Escherichia coli]